MSGSKIVPHILKDTPSLIEHILPVQKLSVDSFREQEARQSKTLTSLGSYWKGRKPLILNKACVLGALLPATKNAEKDLEIFQLLMGMDDESIKKRSSHLPPEKTKDKPYRDIAPDLKRQEELGIDLYDHIWDKVNLHLGTEAKSFPELVDQLGVMRFGHRTIVGDLFSGSGQIPFEAARLGCDVYASDLNPIACMLTWGAFNIVGGNKKAQENLQKSQNDLYEKVLKEIDELGFETDKKGWRGKAYLYCAETTCPQSGWEVPLLPSLMISKGHNVIAELSPNKKTKSYDIRVKYVEDEKEALAAEKSGTVQTEGRGRDSTFLIHTIDGKSYKTKLSTLRGDFENDDGSIGSKLRLWEKDEFEPRDNDIFRERLYAVLWVKTNEKGSEVHEFRAVSSDDIKREEAVSFYLKKNLSAWQKNGYIPSLQIEKGDETERLYKERGWTHWHHLFNPRQLVLNGLINKHSDTKSKFGLFQVLNNNCKLSRWNSRSGVGQTASVFDNQALNTLLNYGCRGLYFCEGFLKQKYKSFPLPGQTTRSINNHPADKLETACDIFITDPPYGDAVKYEEILEFFIGWLKNNPPSEFAKWTWDSRRALAIKGEDEEFRKGMVSAYSAATRLLTDNGLQVIMFTHQSGSIWADMANIVWASGLQVTAAWYVVTETDNALREGSYVKGTVLLVLRKRNKNFKTTRDDLAWEIQEEVENQVKDLTGLNQTIKSKNRDENVFEDADLQMAGYAAALRVLTKYSVIDGREMMTEAIRPRVKGEATFVDSLIEFAVATANQALVPTGIAKTHWEKLLPAERFILKMTDLEIRGAKTLDNYQNFAKAFKVRDFTKFMQSSKANDARLKSAVEFGKTELTEGSELHFSTLRAIYFAMMEIIKEVDTNEVLQHLSFNVKDYYSSGQQRELALALAQYLGARLESIRPEEASAARVLSELIRNQRLG